MPRFRFRGLLAAGAVAGLALAFAPALPDAAPSTQLVTAADLGLDYAPRLVTVTAATQQARTAVVNLGLDVTEHAGHDYVEVVLHSAQDAATLAAAGFDWDVRIPDLVARESERKALDAAYAASVAVSDLPSGRTGYRVLSDFGTEIDELVAAKPGIAKRISIGQSVEGRDLTGIEIGRDVAEPEDGRPVLLMFGVHHAREWPSAELPMEFAHDLVNNYGKDTADGERITDLLDRSRVVIVPVSNPDGYDASRTSGDLVDLRAADGGGTVSILATPGNAYKRKNCRYVDGQTQPAGTCVALTSNGGLGIGIDLNRNYGGLWGGPGASGDQTSALYRGPEPFSEPETQAIRNIISTRQVTTLITNHTFSNLILRPVGVSPATIGPDGSPIGFAPDECFTTADGADYGMQALGERMAAQNGYSNQFGWELYDTTGTTEDYSYNATGGYGYTFEIGADEFHPPYEDVVNEYTGDTSAAEGVTPENASDLTTAAGDDCGGHDVEHDTVGGGNREAYLLALENAVDASTHSVLTGTAPAGSTVTVERTGTFPLWDGTPFEDTVTTSMQVGEAGAFEYHLNPSTRPFVDSRKAPQLSEPRAEVVVDAGLAPPTQTVDHELVVEAPVDLVRATVGSTTPIDGQAVTYNEFFVQLLDPAGNVLAEGREFGPVNSFLYRGIDGAGLEAGTYTVRVSNTLAGGSQYDLEAFAQDVLAPTTVRTDELWTVSCETPDGGTASTDVLVDRGQSVELGELCA